MATKPRVSMVSCLFTLLLLCNSILASVIPRPNEVVARSVLEYPEYSSRVTPRDLNLLVERDLTPPVPSVDDCKAKLTVPRDKSVFYTSIVQTSAEAWANANGKIPIAQRIPTQSSLPVHFTNRAKGVRPSGPRD